MACKMLEIEEYVFSPGLCFSGKILLKIMQAYVNAYLEDTSPHLYIPAVALWNFAGKFTDFRVSSCWVSIST